MSKCDFNEVENMQQIYRRTPMPKCHFNAVALQLYLNHTSEWVFSCKCAAYFQNTFKNTSEGLLLTTIDLEFTSKSQHLAKFLFWKWLWTLGHKISLDFKISVVRSLITKNESSFQVWWLKTVAENWKLSKIVKILIKFIEIILRHGSSPVNSLHIFRIPFPKNTSGGLLLIIVYWSGIGSRKWLKISYN